MIPKETVIAMATALKMDVAAVTAAYDNAESVNLPFDPASVQVFTPTELTARESTLKSRHEKAGMEIEIKEIKAAAGIEFEGKDRAKLIEALKAKTLTEANISESDKLKEANTTIEGLRKNLETVTAEKDSILGQSKQTQLDQEILTWTIDKKPENLSNKEWLTMIKLNNEIVEQDGQMFVKRDGQLVTTTTDLKPIPAKDALVSYIDERKWGKVVDDGKGGQGGRGAGDSKISPLGIGNMKQFNAYIAEKGISPNGQEAANSLNEIIAANTNFDFKTT